MSTTTPAKRHAEVVAEIDGLSRELAAAEREAEEQLRELHGAIVLHEANDAAGRRRRQAIVADIEERPEKLALLRDGLPEVKRRLPEDWEQPHAAELRVAAKNLSTALTGRRERARCGFPLRCCGPEPMSVGRQTATVVMAE